MKYIKTRVNTAGTTFWHIDVDIPEDINYFHEDVLYDIASRYLHLNNWNYKWFRVVRDEKTGELLRNKE